MNSITIFVALTTIIGLVRALPQLIRLLRARHAYGVSVDTAATSSIVSFGWVAYGLLTFQPAISLASGAAAIIFALITILAIHFGRQLKELRIAPVWLGILLVLGYVGGATGLSIALPVSILAANLPQLWVAYTEEDLTDVSLSTWLLSLTEGLVWGSYALIQLDISVLINSGLQATTSGLIVAFKLIHMLKQSQQRDALNA